MKINYLILLVVLTAYFVLLFFPEPETNFLWYMLTFLIFISIIVFLLIKSNKKRKKLRPIK